MTDTVSREKRSETMRAIKSKNTSCELLLRRALRAHGLAGYRLHYPQLAGKPDVVFTKYRVCIFVDGCFWHGCPQCGRLPATNRDYWSAKISRNSNRSREVDSLLTEQGWKVLRFWEHEVRSSVDDCVAVIAAALMASGRHAGD